MTEGTRMLSASDMSLDQEKYRGYTSLTICSVACDTQEMPRGFRDTCTACRAPLQ